MVDSFAEFDDAPSLDREKFGLYVYPNFITSDVHDGLVSEINSLVRRSRYESGHWDGVIQGYREHQSEIKKLSPLFQDVSKSVYDQFPKDSATPRELVHILDLKAEPDGRIDNHVDSIRFSGGVVAGLCLLSDAVLHLVHEESKEKVVVLLPNRCLYIMSRECRYRWGHAIVSDGVFKGEKIVRSRRISVMYRDEFDQKLVEEFVPLESEARQRPAPRMGIITE